jgi:DNA-binding transcriptional ArsR family regulator
MPTKSKRATRLPTELEAAKALSHPVRAATFRLLGEKTASPKDLAIELEEPLGNVSYHVRELLNLNCITLVDTAPRRGAIEHYYKATAKATITVKAL